jgi:hypothetical protein
MLLQSGEGEWKNHVFKRSDRRSRSSERP